MFGALVNKIDKFLGMFFFNNLNTFSYGTFNFFYNKKIQIKKKKVENEQIREFDTKGFVILKCFDIEKIKRINECMKKQNPFQSDANRFMYNIDDEMKNLFKRIVKEDINKILSDLKIYYNSNIYLAHAIITRNYNYVPKKTGVVSEKKGGETFSSFFHCDAYLNNYFRLLINLSDVNENMGPTHILDKEQTKKNVNIFKYSSRSLEKEKKIKSKIFKNISPIGSGLLISTPQCLHKAGIPEKNYYRDMLNLVFCAYPNTEDDIFYYANKDNTTWGYHKTPSNLVKIFGKPYGYKKLVYLYKKFLKNKLYNI